MTKDPAKKDIDRIAKAVRERRESLGLSQDLSPFGGPKRNLVGGLETRGVWPRLPMTRSKWARALQWAPDAFDKLLAGEEPTELNPSGPVVPADARLSELEQMRAMLDQAIASHQPAPAPRAADLQARFVEADAVFALMERLVDEVRTEFMGLLRESGRS